MCLMKKEVYYDPTEKAQEVCEVCYGSGHTAGNCPKNQLGAEGNCKVCGLSSRYRFISRLKLLDSIETILHFLKFVIQ